MERKDNFNVRISELCDSKYSSNKRIIKISKKKCNVVIMYTIYIYTFYKTNSLKTIGNI